MELSKQVVSLELAKRMKELGFKQDGIFKWRLAGNYDWQIEPSQGILIEGYSAYTATELGEMLPEEFFTTLKELGKFHIHGHYSTNPDSLFYPSETETDARAKMLIYLKKNNLI